MKSSVVIFLVFGVAIAGGIVWLSRPRTTPTPLSSASSQPEPAVTATPTVEKPFDANQALPGKVSEKPAEPAPAIAAAPMAPANRAPSQISQAVDGLLYAKSGAQKHELFQQLVKAGQIDQVIAELKQRALDNPNDPAIPTTLGEALLNKVKALHDAGGDTDEIGILAMQADQSFNAALKIDPKSWEAQFVKASTMYYWPAEPTRDNDVVQRLSNLIDQQETMPTQPEFAQTYVVLGNEYQKIGQPDKALATWQLGAQKFPNDPSLQKKLSGQ